ncbi:4-hydroxy-tetrahydrodipicolinate synthase [Aerococcaceae bacterium 50-4]
MTIFKGSAVAIVTPYDNSLEQTINYDVFAELIEFQIKNGTDAIVVAGTTGEASTQTDAEQVELVKFCVDQVNGRVPVIAGAGSNDTAHGIQLTKDCVAAGADAILSVTPYYLKTSQAGLLAHYSAIADAVKPTPIILYDVPGRTGMSIAPKTLAELKNIENIVAIKDATGDLANAVDARYYVGPDFDVYSGNDDTVVPLMSLGCQGVISVLANIAPKQVRDMTHFALNGDYEKATEIQTAFKPLIDILFSEPNPIPIKKAMSLLGFDTGSVRLPLVPAQEETVAALEAEMKRLNLI